MGVLLRGSKCSTVGMSQSDRRHRRLRGSTCPSRQVNVNVSGVAPVPRTGRQVTPRSSITQRLRGRREVEKKVKTLPPTAQHKREPAAHQTEG